jgi:hypothetical protein
MVRTLFGELIRDFLGFVRNLFTTKKARINFGLNKIEVGAGPGFASQN